MSQPDLDGNSPSTQVMLTRLFKAPRALVFKAWSQPELMQRWWSGEHFTTPVMKMDFRVGGSFTYCMRTANGDIWGRGDYLEIIVPEKIVWSDNFTDAEGKVVPPSTYGLSSDDTGGEMVTVTFIEEGEQTRITMRMDVDKYNLQERGFVEQGWNEMLSNLEAQFAES